MHTKAAIIAAEALVRDGIRSMLSADCTVKVVGETANFADIPQVRRRVDPDLFIIDASGLRAYSEAHARQIRSLVDMADRPLVLLAEEGVQSDMEVLRLGVCVLQRSRMSSADLVSSVRLLAMRLSPRGAAPGATTRPPCAGGKGGCGGAHTSPDAAGAGSLPPSRPR